MFIEDYAKFLTVLEESVILRGRSGDLRIVLPKGLQGRILNKKTFADRFHLPRDNPKILRMVYFVSGLRCRAPDIPEQEYEGTHSFELMYFENNMKKSIKDNLPARFRLDY